MDRTIQIFLLFICLLGTKKMLSQQLPSDLPWEAGVNCEGVPTILNEGMLVVTCGNATPSTITDPVLVIKDVRNLYYSSVPHDPPAYHHPDWTFEKIGGIYMTETDVYGNIYAPASYVQYGNKSPHRYGDIGGGADSKAAAGTVYKLDATTGAASVFSVLPQNHTKLGLGGIVYNEECNGFFVSNIADGKIYRLDHQGNILDTYDPLNPYKEEVWVPMEERIFGLDIYEDRLYYSIQKVGGYELFVYVGSVGISNCGFNGNEKIEIDEKYSGIGTTSVIGDIDFNANGELAIGFFTNTGNPEFKDYLKLYNHDGPVFIYQKINEEWQITGYTPVAAHPYYKNDGTNKTCTGGVAWNRYNSENQLDVLWMAGGDFPNNDGNWGVIGYDKNQIDAEIEPIETASRYVMFLYENNEGDPKGLSGTVSLYKGCNCIITESPNLPITTFVNTCPNKTIDVTGVIPTNIPNGAILSWYNDYPFSRENQLSADQLSMLPAGIYYVTYYVPSQDCYGSITSVNIEVQSCCKSFRATPDLDCICPINNNTIDIPIDINFDANPLVSGSESIVISTDKGDSQTFELNANLNQTFIFSNVDTTNSYIPTTFIIRTEEACTDSFTICLPCFEAIGDTMTRNAESVIGGNNPDLATGSILSVGTIANNTNANLLDSLNANATIHLGHTVPSSTELIISLAKADDMGSVDITTDRGSPQDIEKTSITVSSDITYDSNLSKILNNDYDNQVYFYPKGASIVDKTYLQFDFQSPIILTTIELGVHNKGILNAGAILVVQGSRDSTIWIDVSGNITTDGTKVGEITGYETAENFSFEENNIPYRYYRLRGINGTLINWYLQEVNFLARTFCNDEIEDCPNTLTFDTGSNEELQHITYTITEETNALYIKRNNGSVWIDGISYRYVEPGSQVCIPKCKCEIDLISNIQSTCQDNGTSSNPTDDYFTLTITASGQQNGRYEVVAGANADGTGGIVLGTQDYGTAITLGDGINGEKGIFSVENTYTIIIRDVVEPSCNIDFTTIPLSPCSDECQLTLVLDPPVYNDNNTPEDLTDDTFTFALTVDNSPADAAGWQGGGKSGAYGEKVIFGPYAVGGEGVSFSITDVLSGGNCSVDVGVNMPPCVYTGDCVCCR